MAVTVVSNLSTWNAADNTTGWTSDGGGLSAYSGFQREGTNCLGEQASNGAVNVYYATTAVNMSAGYTIFGPWLRSGNPTSQSTGGFRIVVGDGTDRAAYYVGGSDNYGFFYNGYSLFRLDLNQRASYTNTTLAGGGDGSLTTSNISQIGGGWNYGSKAVGNSDNVFLDIVRYIANGTKALSVRGGTTGDRGTFDEIVALDENTANAWGIIRRAVQGAKAYELNYGIQFGLAASDSYFQDSDFQLFINGANMTAGNMNVEFVANNGGVTGVFNISNFDIISVGTAANFSLLGSHMQLNNGQFTDIGTLAIGSTANSYCTNVTFSGCGLTNFNGASTSFVASNNAYIDTEGVLLSTDIDVTNSIFNGCLGVTYGAAMYFNTTGVDSDGVIDGCSFTKGTPTKHAIRFGSGIPTTITIRDVDFSGYNSSNGQTDSAMWFNDTSGTITVNIIGGSGTPSYRSDGATIVIVQNPVTTRVIARNALGEEVAGARVLVKADGWSGTHTGTNNSATLTDSSQNWVTNELVGYIVRNFSNSATGTITANTATTVTATLSGGSPDNDWDTNDQYSINAGPFDYREIVAITRLGSTASVAHLDHGLSTGQYIVISEADQNEYNGVHQITVTTANSYTFTVTGTPVTPATGSPRATVAIVYGVTDANGEISDSRTFASDQEITGWVRKSSATPLYKTAPLTGTINSANGATLVGIMIEDQS